MMHSDCFPLSDYPSLCCNVTILKTKEHLVKCLPSTNSFTNQKTFYSTNCYFSSDKISFIIISDPIVGYKVRRDVTFSLQKFFKSVYEACGYNPAVAGVPWRVS